MLEAVETWQLQASFSIVPGKFEQDLLCQVDKQGWVGNVIVVAFRVERIGNKKQTVEMSRFSDGLVLRGSHILL